MYLKGLELQGFKSFPDRIRLDFNKGITAVVGPNGSGKSNISDAVRWVLGEKSAKSLRGSKMEDIIFSGTAFRKQMGFAEVTLIMDNSDRVLNLDYSEVSVTRKVYRTGDSEYMINGALCRQRDILELFMDTGIGKEGYSIIGQGRIDEILSNKSEDRRTLFEEAAGIVKYKARCSETQNNLEHTMQNLTRVNDIISELEAQVGPLEKQAEKAKKYRSLYETLKKIQISIFVEDADKYEREIKQLEEQASALTADTEASRREQQRLEESKEGLREGLQGVLNRLDSIALALTEKRAEQEKRSGDIRLCDNNTLHINEGIARKRGDIEANQGLIAASRSTLAELNTRLSAKAIELKNKTDKYQSRRSELEETAQRLSQGEEELNRYNEAMFERLNRRSALTASASELNAVLRQFEVNDKSSNEILSSYDAKIEQTKTALAAEDLELERIELEGGVIAENINRYNEENTKITAILSQKEQRLKDASKAADEKSSRIRVLSDLKRDYEGYYGGVKAILKLRDSHTKGFEGIYGAVGEVITMPARLETAIETALGGAVQNLIAHREEDVKNAINYLKERRLGRATFLPMNAVRGRALGADRQSIINSKGVIGIAKELIDYDPKYEGIMSSLLDRVIVVDNIDNGILLARQTKYAYKIVSLEGDLFNPGGSMTGGSTGKKSAGIFARTREINDLTQALEKLNKEKAELTAETEKIRLREEDIAESLAEASEELQELALAKNEYTIKANHIKAELAALEKEKAEHILRMEELSRSLEETRAKAEQSQRELDALSKEIDELKEKTDSFSGSLKADKESRDRANEELILMNGEINTLKGEYEAAQRAIADAEESITALEGKNAELTAEIEADKSLLAEQQTEKQSLQQLVSALGKECEELISTQKGLNEEKDKMTALSEEYEQRIRNVLQTVSSLEKEQTRIMGRREQAEQRSSELYNRMFETYEITYVAAKSYPPLNIKYEEKKREENRLKGEIRQLGSVNVNAVEEYAAVKERYDSYIKQQADIIDTEQKLREIIAQLQGLMETQFREQFKIISENFSRVFAEMFGGGKAALKLSDDEDVLNCGIDIEAQPPGKALQNMTLLSGGEKAMTAISLLFAILEMKPSPFCILDEIEAALDDANVVRFAEYLRNFTDTTQFIVITHRPGTREVADTLYGVTQESGISKLFSTNIDEIIKERESNGDI